MDYGEGSQKRFHTMTFTDIDVNFDITYDGDQKPSNAHRKYF